MDVQTSPRWRSSALGTSELLRLLAGGSDPAILPSFPTRSARWFSPGLDDKTRALIRLAALVATGGSPASFKRYVADALAAGATDDDVLETLTSVSRTVGLARVVSATGGLALGLGYDIEAAFEGIEEAGTNSSAGGMR